MRRPLVPTLLTIFGATFAITGVSALEACDDEARPSEPDASPPDGVKAPNPGVPVTPGKPIENDDAGGVEAGVDDAGPDADTDAAPPAKRSRVFVTRTRYAGDLKVTGTGTDGLVGGDLLCQAAANAGALGGSWRAWLSTSNVDAIDRLEDRAPWYLVNRTTLVFAKKSDLTSPPAHAIDMNETGGTLVTGGLNLVWSGTKRDGTRDPGFHCLDWTSAAGTESGTVGNYRETTTWTRYALDPHEICDKTRPIYCFEQ